MTFNRRESAEWALAADAEVEKLLIGVNKALADGASRGFPAPSGDTLASLLALGQDSKGKLVEADGKIYDARRKVLFEQDEFALKILVQLARLGMELYRADLFNALELEQAQQQATIERSRADVERQNAETELRQKAIIMAHAEMERRIIIYKAQLVEAETTTLTAEAILINAQLATAEKKLEIIASIYQVLAAEELVLAAEQRRADSLTKVLAAELITAGVKREMIPYYLQKAEAREELAAAIIAEIPITEALIRLGYDRIDLKTTEEYAGHLEREQQEELELLKEAFTRASTALEITKTQSRRLLLEYRNAIQAQIMNKKKSLEEDGISFKLSSALERMTVGVDNEVALDSNEVLNLSDELKAITAGLAARGATSAATIAASTNTNSTSILTKTYQRFIRSGEFVA